MTTWMTNFPKHSSPPLDHWDKFLLITGIALLTGEILIRGSAQKVTLNTLWWVKVTLFFIYLIPPPLSSSSAMMINAEWPRRYFVSVAEGRDGRWVPKVFVIQPSLKSERRWCPWNEFHNGPIKTKNRDNRSEKNVQRARRGGWGFSIDIKKKKEALSSIYDVTQAKWIK